jgi:hypothetical protein
MQIALYYAPITCALAPYITLTEAGAEFEVRPLNLLEHTGVTAFQRSKFKDVAAFKGTEALHRPQDSRVMATTVNAKRETIALIGSDKVEGTAEYVQPTARLVQCKG